MSALSTTLQALLHLGFDLKEPQYGMPCVSYALPHLQLSCCDGISKYFRKVVLVSGVFNNGRTRHEVSHEIPPDIETEESAAASLVYAIKPNLNQISPEPDWVSLGRANQMLVPMVARQVEYERRPVCRIDADFARVLRKRYNTLTTGISDTVPLSVQFDGKLLRLASAENSIEVPASGTPWTGYIVVSEIGSLEFPKRISDTGVVLDYWQNLLHLGNRSCEANWIGDRTQ